MASKSTAKEMVEIPKDEYRILKEIYKTVKRQRQNRSGKTGQ